MSFELFTLGLVGVTVIITAGSIFEGIREKVSSFSPALEKLINCPMCTGFWVGLFFGIITDYGPPLILGGLVSLLSWIIYTVTYYFSIKSEWYQIQVTSDQEDNSNNENIAEDDKDA